MKIIKNAKITWIDISKPTKENLLFIKKQHKFHPVILDEILHPSARSHVEVYSDYLFMTYHLPSYNQTNKTSQKAEIDFLITKNTLITIHYEELEPINKFIKELETKINLRETMMKNTGKVVYGLLEEIIDFSTRQLRHIEEDVTSLTQELFNGHEEEMLKKISYAKRNILAYRVISRPQEIILQSLREAGAKFWGEEMRIYLSDLIGDHLKVTQQLENYCETVEGLDSTNIQLLNAKTTAVMKKFTVLAFLTFPMILVIAFFTVGSIDKLINSDAGIFMPAFIGALAIIIILLIIFKKKKWL